MVNAKKTKKQLATDNNSKKVTFSQEKKVKTFDKNKALIGKRKVEEVEEVEVQQPKKTLKSSLKTKVTKSVKSKVELESSDDDDEEEEEEDHIEEKEEDNENDSSDAEDQEEALRKEIMGDLVEFGVSDSSDSSDEEEQEDNTGKSEELIKLAKKMKMAHEKAKNKLGRLTPKATKEEEKGWVYIGRIPKELVERDIYNYFSQFGDILRHRISKSKKGKSRHYGFIEFASSEVAEIVAETMNNFSIKGHTIQCTVIPPERRHEKTFEGNETPDHNLERFRKERQLLTRNKSLQEYIDRAQKLVSSEESKNKKLRRARIDYSFDGFQKSFEHWKPIFDLQLKKAELETGSNDKKASKKTKRAN